MDVTSKCDWSIDGAATLRERRFRRGHEPREARELETGGARVKAFAAGIESAHVAVLAHANHYVFRSNETDVLQEMILPTSSEARASWYRR